MEPWKWGGLGRPGEAVQGPEKGRDEGEKGGDWSEEWSQDVGMRCGRVLRELGWFGEKRVGHQEEWPSEERGEELGWGLGRGMWRA